MKSIKVLAAAAVILSSICILGVQNVYASVNEESAEVKSDVEEVVSTGESTIDKTEEKSQSRVKKATVTLDENPTTGYTWKYKIDDDNSCVKIESTKYKSYASSPDICGAGGKRTWIFNGVKEGETKIIFNNTRGEFDDLDLYSETKAYLFKVDKDLNVTVSECEPAVKKDGWVKNEDSKWSYYKDGESLKMQWLRDGSWYYLNNEGIMVTGWNKIRGYWYYFNTSGAMKTGWLKDSGSWYYLRGSGVMASGWIEDSGEWYYMNQSGVMLANTTVDGYKLGSSGAWIK